MKKILIVVAIIVGAVLLYRFGAYSVAFAEFDGRREDWKRRCLKYKDQELITPEQQACNTELNQIVAEGRAKGYLK